MSSEESARQLRRLLSELKASQELERVAAQRREMARSQARSLVAELHRDFVVPSLRAFAEELERQGHLTRLERRSPTAARLHVQVQGRRAIAATVEAEWQLGQEPRLATWIRHQFRDEGLERLAADETTAERLAQIWVRLLERLATLATR